MKKRILSLLVFVLLFFSGCKYLNRVFQTQHIYENTIEDFRKLSKSTNIDVVFYGSSHTFTAYNPAIVNKNCSTISFNLGSDAQRLPTTNFVLKETYEYTNPKLVILEVYWASMKFPEDEKIKGYQLRALDFIEPLSINRLTAIEYLYDKKDYLNAQFPLLRNHGKWSAANFTKLSKRANIDKKRGLYYDGYIGFKEIISEADKEKFKDFNKVLPRKHTKKRDISSDEKNELVRFVNLAKNAGSKVLIISSPDLRARLYPSYFDQLKDITNSLNVPLLNLNDYYDSIGLSLNDFKDKSHLNLDGGIKTSTFLANYINKNFDLKNRKSEKIWNEKSLDYKRFITNRKSNSSKKVGQISNFELLENIVFEKVKVSKKDDAFTINIKLASDIKRDVLEKYKLAIQLYPVETELDLLGNYSKSKGRKFESTYIYMEEFTDSLNLTMNAKFSNLKLMKMYLFDKDGYKGIVGKPFIVDNPIIN